MGLKWSQFVFWVESLEDKNKIIIRSTLTGAIVRIEKCIKQKIDEFLENKNSSSPQKQIRRHISQLTELGMIVSLDRDESKSFYESFQKTRMNSSIFVVHIVTTTNCQLNCPYCYEDGIQGETMSFEIADKIVFCCKNYLDENNQCNKFRVIWYGGEPLLNKKIIRYMLPKLYRVGKEKNIEFDNQIVTNGLLMDKKMALFLAEYNLSRVQITLDGPKRMHDQRRIRKNGAGTFDQIFQNILHIAEVKKISLRVNFDKHNIDSVPELLDLIVKHKLQKNIELSFGIITSTVCGDSRKKSKTHTDKYGFNDVENVEKYIWLYTQAKQRGIIMPDEFMLGPWCVARDAHSVMIEPDGSLVKCFSGVGRKEFIFGDINLTFGCYDCRFNDFRYFEECLRQKCPYLPICGGGCRFESFVHTGNFQERYCQLQLIEGINKGLTQINYS